MRLRFARRPLGRAQDHFPRVFPAGTVRMRHDDTGMRRLPLRRLPVKEIEGLRLGSGNRPVNTNSEFRD